jgi:hypothetical protein
MSINQVGSTLSLLFQSKAITFTPDTFTKLFQEHGFTVTEGLAQISTNPAAMPVKTIYFSKGNLMVYYNPAEFLVIFQILNTLNFSQIYESDIKPVLARLNFVPEVVQMMGLICGTKITSEKSPTLSISSLVKNEFISKISSLVGVTNLRPFTMRVVGGESDEGLDLDIEPLATDQEHTFYFTLSYKTSDNSKFNNFVSMFNEDLIKNIIKEVTKYV